MISSADIQTIRVMAGLYGELANSWISDADIAAIAGYLPGTHSGSEYRASANPAVAIEAIRVVLARGVPDDRAAALGARIGSIYDYSQGEAADLEEFTDADIRAMLARIALLEANDFTQSQAATLESELKNLISQVQAGEQADLANYYTKAFLDATIARLQTEIDGKHGALSPSEQRVVDRFVFVDGDLSIDARHYDDYDGKIIIADSNSINGQSIDFAGGNIPSDFNCEVWCVGSRCAFTDSSPVAIQSSIPGDALLRGDKAVVYKIQNTGPGVVRLAVDYANRGSHASSSSRVEQLAQDITTLRALVATNTSDIGANRDAAAALKTRMDAVEVKNAAQDVAIANNQRELVNNDSLLLPADATVGQIAVNVGQRRWAARTPASGSELTDTAILDAIQSTRGRSDRGKELAVSYTDENAIVLREDTDYYVLSGDTELQFTPERNQNVSSTQWERTYTSTVGDSILLQGINSLVEVNLGVPRGWYVLVACDAARDNTNPAFTGNQILAFDSGVTVTGDYSVVSAGDVYEVRGTAANAVNIRRIWPVQADPVHLPTLAQLINIMLPGGVPRADRNDILALSNGTGIRLLNPQGRVLTGASILASLDSTPAARDYGKYIELRPGTTDGAGDASLVKLFDVTQGHEVAIRSDVRGDISNIENRLYHETWGAMVVLHADDSSIGFLPTAPIGWWCHVKFEDDRSTATPWYSTGAGITVTGVDQVAGHIAPKADTIFRMICCNTNELRLEEVYPVTRAHYSPTRPYNVNAEAGSDVNTGATANSDSAGVHARTWASLDGAVIKMTSDGSTSPEINLNTGAPIGTQFEVIFSGDMVGSRGAWLNAANGVTVLPSPRTDLFFGSPKDDAVWNLKCVDTNQWYISVTGPPPIWPYYFNEWTNSATSRLLANDVVGPYQWITVQVFGGVTGERKNSTHYIPALLGMAVNGGWVDDDHGIELKRESTGIRVNARGTGVGGAINTLNFIRLHSE